MMLKKPQRSVGGVYPERAEGPRWSCSLPGKEFMRKNPRRGLSHVTALRSRETFRTHHRSPLRGKAHGDGVIPGQSDCVLAIDDRPEHTSS